MRILRLIIFSATFALLSLPGIEAGGLRVALLANTEVQSDTILLANLLPANASQRIRDAAKKIALGAAPQRGTVRQFNRETLDTAIAAGGLSTADFAIPDSVTVRRGSRLISREEILVAIESALTKNPVAGITILRLNDIGFEAAVRVPPGDAGLEVTQIIFDQFIGRARFRLWAKSAPGTLPFYVTAKVAAIISGPQASGQLLSAVAHPQTANDISSPVLVATDRRARLHLHSSNMEMLLEVRPLQRGHLGEVIRVRLAGSGRTMQARVTAAGYLDATL
jgi:hypothetical protein